MLASAHLKLDADKKKSTALAAGLNKIQVYDSESDSDSQEVSMNKINKKRGGNTPYAANEKTISTAKNNIQKAMFRLWRLKM